MDNRNNNLKDSNSAILVLFVLFFAIVLRDATTGTLSSSWLNYSGFIIMGLLLSAIFSDGTKHWNMRNNY